MMRTLFTFFLLLLSATLGFIAGTGKAHFLIVQQMTAQIESVHTELALLKLDLA